MLNKKLKEPKERSLQINNVALTGSEAKETKERSWPIKNKRFNVSSKEKKEVAISFRGREEL